MSNLDRDMVTVRPVTHADCAAMHRFFRTSAIGYDDTLFAFHEIVESETHFGVVAEVNGHIVGFSCAVAIDDGYAMVRTRANIQKNFRGKGIIIKLGEAMFNAVKSKFPNLQRGVWSSEDVEVSMTSIALHPDMKLDLSLSLESIITCSEDLKALCNSESFHELESKYRVADISTVSRRKALQVLTEEIRFLDYAPKRPMIAWQPSGWHKSTLVAELQMTEVLVSRCPMTSKIIAFGFLTRRLTNEGIRVDQEFYSSSSSGAEELAMSHLLYGIGESAVVPPNRKVTIYFIYPASITANALKGLVNIKLGLQSDTSTALSLESVFKPANKL